MDGNSRQQQSFEYEFGDHYRLGFTFEFLMALYWLGVKCAVEKERKLWQILFILVIRYQVSFVEFPYAIFLEYHHI